MDDANTTTPLLVTWAADHYHVRCLSATYTGHPYRCGTNRLFSRQDNASSLAAGGVRCGDARASTPSTMCLLTAAAATATSPALSCYNSSPHLTKLRQKTSLTHSLTANEIFIALENVRILPFTTTLPNLVVLVTLTNSGSLDKSSTVNSGTCPWCRLVLKLILPWRL